MLAPQRDLFQGTTEHQQARSFGHVRVHDFVAEHPKMTTVQHSARSQHGSRPSDLLLSAHYLVLVNPRRMKTVSSGDVKMEDDAHGGAA